MLRNLYGKRGEVKNKEGTKREYWNTGILEYWNNGMMGKIPPGLPLRKGGGDLDSMAGGGKGGEI